MTKVNADATILAQLSASSPNGRIHFAGLIPLVAISGSRGKSTVACMLDAIIRSSGKSVGMWLSSGVYADGERLSGELGPWQRVMLAARHGELDIAIQELDAATVVAIGLPTESYPLALATTICGNNEACLLTSETRLERQSLDLVLRSVRRDGLVMAGADDLKSLRRPSSARPARALRVTQRESGSRTASAQRRHRSLGGRQIALGSAGNSQAIIPSMRFPRHLTARSCFQIQNALAARLGCYRARVSVPQIVQRSSSFLPIRRSTISVQIIAYNGARIVVDAPRQVWTLRMLMRGVVISLADER